jgi:electron transport complex protein RnfC
MAGTNMKGAGMIRKPFLGLTRQKLDATPLPKGAPPVRQAPVCGTAVLFVPRRFEGAGTCSVKAGDPVRLGQKVGVYSTGEYVISPVAGVVQKIEAHTGAAGEAMTAITFEGQTAGEAEKLFAKPGLGAALECLENAAGGLSLKAFSNPDKPINTVIIIGMDQDLLVTARQQVVRDKAKSISKGVKALKEMVNPGRMVFAVPPALAHEAVETGCEVARIDTAYPKALPALVLAKLGLTVPTGSSPGDSEVAVLSAEAVATLGEACETGAVPMEKYVTVIGKDGASKNIAARVGMPLGAVLAAAGVTAGDGDRVVLGGPLRGTATYSLDLPVEPDTDAILVQDKAAVEGVSDYPCLNCGECVAVCPARVPVNMLIRYLENRLYEDAAKMYDLHSCVECGLCSYVCVAQIPVFQYIMLAKRELARTGAEE